MIRGKVIDTTYKTITGKMVGVGLDIKLSNRVSIDPEVLHIVPNDTKGNSRSYANLSLGVHW